MEIGDIEPSLMVQKEDIEGMKWRIDQLEERAVQQEIRIRRLTKKLEELDSILLRAVRK